MLCPMSYDLIQDCRQTNQLWAESWQCWQLFGWATGHGKCLQFKCDHFKLFNLLNFKLFFMAYGCRQFLFGQLTIVCVAFHHSPFIICRCQGVKMQAQKEPSVKIIFYRQVPHDETDSGEAGEEVYLFHKDIRSCWRTKTANENDVQVLRASWQSTTPPSKPLSHDRYVIITTLLIIQM